MTDDRIQWGRPGAPEAPTKMPDGSYLSSMEWGDDADDAIEIEAPDLLMYAIGLVAFGAFLVLAFRG